MADKNNDNDDDAGITKSTTSGGIMTPEEEEQVEMTVETFTNDSAFMIAYERALETAKGEEGGALIHDPFAKRLSGGSRGKALSDAFGANTHAAFELWPDFHKQWTVVRTKFIDDHIRRQVAKIQEEENNSNDDSNNNKMMQLVNLGAGLDTRCFRLDCIETGVISKAFEVDMEEINDPKAKIFKALRMEPLCHEYALVTADLTVEGQLAKELQDNGFNRDRPTIFLAEGIIMYLGESALQFLREISALASSGSVLILNFMNTEANPHVPVTGEEIIQEVKKCGWSSSNLQINKYGDDVLNYGRFEKGYEPSPAFSFLVGYKA